MIGVRRDYMGRGLARVLIGAVHELARLDTGSSGVSLDTESEANVSLYQHLGYTLLGHARVDEGLTTWALFKRKNQEPA
jgi:GNAT superfamily N-acetyltransferase